MSQVSYMNAKDANQRAQLVAGALSDFLSAFNTTYPDSEAETVASHFDYLTSEYLVQTCASVLAGRFVVRPTGVRLAAPKELNFDIAALVTSTDDLDLDLTFGKVRDRSEARALELEAER